MFLSPGQLGYYLGKGIVYFAIVAIILALAARHRKPFHKSLILLAGTLAWAGYLTFAVVSVNTASTQLTAAKSELRSLVNIGTNILDVQDNLTSANTSDTAASSSATNVTLASSIRKMNLAMQDVFSRAHKKQAKIVAEIDNIGMERILLPQTLTSREGIRRNRSRIATYRMLAKRSLAISDAANRELGKRIKPLFAGTTIESQFLNGYANGERSRQQLMDKFRAAQISMINSMDHLNEFMASELGKVRLEDNHPVFQTQREVNAYNRLLKNIRHQVQLIRKLRAKRQSKAHSMLKQLQKLAS
jgi:hypothetical protein